jgi:hypothetical protein
MSSAWEWLKGVPGGGRLQALVLPLVFAAAIAVAFKMA